MEFDKEERQGWGVWGTGFESSIVLVSLAVAKSGFVLDALTPVRPEGYLDLYGN